MKTVRNICIVVIVFFFMANTLVLAQEPKADTARILKFDKPNLLEIYPGLFSTRFNFSDPRSNRSDYSLLVNSNGYTGAFINYNWLSLKYTWAMPGTSLDKNVKMSNTSLSFRFTGNRTILHSFFDTYNGLLIHQKTGRNKYEPFRGIRITDAGTDFYYFTNGSRYSPRAANFYSELQTKSAGSLFGMVTPLWQKVNWISPSSQLISDTETFSLLSSNPAWVSFIARLGYTYNMVFQNGKWNIAPAVIVGTGALKEINTVYKSIQAVKDLQAWINAGYNGRDYYAYLNGSVSNLQTNLFIARMHVIKTDFSITFGYRFHSLRKKIFGIV